MTLVELKVCVEGLVLINHAIQEMMNILTPELRRREKILEEGGESEVEP